METQVNPALQMSQEAINAQFAQIAQAEQQQAAQAYQENMVAMMGLSMQLAKWNPDLAKNVIGLSTVVESVRYHDTVNPGWLLNEQNQQEARLFHEKKEEDKDDELVAA